MEINYFKLFVKALTFAFIVLAIKIALCSVAKAEMYEYPDYYNPNANNYVGNYNYVARDQYISTPIRTNGFSSSAPEPVYVMPTGAPNTVLVHPVQNPFAAPQPAFIYKK